MDSKQTLENVKVIQNLIEPMKNNPKFAKLILYSLSTIKSIISLNEKQSVEAFSKLLLTKTMFDIIKNLFLKNIENEEILTKLGELIFCLVKLRQHEFKTKPVNIKSSKTMNNTIGSSFGLTSASNNNILPISTNPDAISKNELFAYVLEFLSLLNQSFIESYQIFIKVLQALSSESEISLTTTDNSSSNLYSVFSISLSLLGKLSSNQIIVLYLIETIKKLFLSEKLRIKGEDQIKLVTEINKIVNNMENYHSNTVVRECFQLLKIIIHTHDEARECYKKSKPISLIIKVLSSSGSDNSLSFYCMQLLADVIERKDIELFLKFLKETNSYGNKRKDSTIRISVGNINESKLTEVGSSSENEMSKEQMDMIVGIFSEFQNQSFAEDSSVTLVNEKTQGENLENNKKTEGNNQSNITTPNNNVLIITPDIIIFLRKSIATVLIMIAKDQNFLKILGELNSIETLLQLIQIELESIVIEDDELNQTKNKEMAEGKVEANDLIDSILPNFMKLVFTLLSDIETQNTPDNESKNKLLISKIGLCLLKALNLLKNDKKSVIEIIDILLTTKNQLLLESMAEGFFKSFRSVYLNNYDEQKVVLLIMKMNTVALSMKRQQDLSVKGLKRVDVNTSKNDFCIGLINYENLVEQININLKKIEKVIDLKGKASIIRKNFSQNITSDSLLQRICKLGTVNNNNNTNLPGIEENQFENNIELEDTIKDLPINTTTSTTTAPNTSKLRRSFTNNNIKPEEVKFSIFATKETDEIISIINKNFLNISFGMIFESVFPENLFHEFCIMVKLVHSILTNHNKLQNFSMNSNLIKICNNFLVVAFANQKFGLQEEKLNLYSQFLSYVMLESGLDLSVNNFILKQIDFFLLPESKGFCKQIINHPMIISFLTGTMRDFIKQLRTMNDQIRSTAGNTSVSPITGNSSNLTTNNIGGHNTQQFYMRFGSNNYTKKFSIVIDDNNNNGFGINNQEQINGKTKIEGEVLELLLKSISLLLKFNTTNSYAQYIRENGVVMIIELCGIKVFDFETSKLIVKTLQRFSSEGLFKVSTQYFKK